MKFPVSRIANTALRRTVICVTFPIFCAVTVPLCAWNALVDVVCWWATLLRTAKEQW